MLHAFFAVRNTCSDKEREKNFQGRWKSGQSLLSFIKLLMRQHTWHGLDKPPGKLFQYCLGQALNSPLAADGFPMRSPPRRTSELPVISHPEMFVLGVTFWKMHVLPYKSLKKDLKINLIKSLWFLFRFELFNLLTWLRINSIYFFPVPCIIDSTEHWLLNQQIALTE